MSKQLTILIDMDDTIEDLIGEWVKALNTRHHLNVSKSDIKDWNVSRFFPSLSNQEVYSVLDEDSLWNAVTPLPGAVEYVKRLIDNGNRVYICTATGYQHLKVKMESILFRYFPYLTWKDVIVTSHKQLINADILIVDGIHNLIGGTYSKMLMDAPHNRNFDAESNGMTRVYNWEQAYEHIYAYQNGGI